MQVQSNMKVKHNKSLRQSIQSIKEPTDARKVIQSIVEQYGYLLEDQEAGNEFIQHKIQFSLSPNEIFMKSDTMLKWVKCSQINFALQSIQQQQQTLLSLLEHCEYIQLCFGMNEQYETQIVDIINNIKHKEQQINDLAEDNTKLQAEHNEYIKAVNQIKLEINRWMQINESKEKDIEQLNHKNQQNLTIMNKQDEDLMQFQQKYDQHTDKIHEFKNQISSNTEGAKQERDHWINEYQIKNDQLSQISQEYINTIQMEQHLIKKNQLISELLQKMLDIEHNTNTYKKLEDEEQQQQQILDDHQNQLKEVMAQIQQETQQCTKYRQQIQQMDHMHKSKQNDHELIEKQYQIQLDEKNIYLKVQLDAQMDQKIEYEQRVQSTVISISNIINNCKQQLIQSTYDKKQYIETMIQMAKQYKSALEFEHDPEMNQMMEQMVIDE